MEREKTGEGEEQGEEENWKQHKRMILVDRLEKKMNYIIAPPCHSVFLPWTSARPGSMCRRSLSPIDGRSMYILLSYRTLIVLLSYGVLDPNILSLLSSPIVYTWVVDGCFGSIIPRHAPP